MERRADLVAVLDDGTIFHFEFQGYTDDDITYRSGIYCFLIAQRHRRKVNQIVLYVGGPKMRMVSRLDAGSAIADFRLLDIREFDADQFLRRGLAGDLVLAMLANGGTERLTEIATLASQLKGKARARVLTQLALLSGLRQVSGRLRMG